MSPALLPNSPSKPHPFAPVERFDIRILFLMRDDEFMAEPMNVMELSALATQAAQDNAGRLNSLDKLRRLREVHGKEVELIGYHDFTEFPAGTDNLYP